MSRAPTPQTITDLIETTSGSLPLAGDNKGVHVFCVFYSLLPLVPDDLGYQLPTWPLRRFTLSATVGRLRLLSILLVSRNRGRQDNYINKGLCRICRTPEPLPGCRSGQAEVTQNMFSEARSVDINALLPSHSDMVANAPTDMIPQYQNYQRNMLTLLYIYICI